MIDQVSKCGEIYFELGLDHGGFESELLPINKCFVSRYHPLSARPDDPKLHMILLTSSATLSGPLTINSYLHPPSSVRVSSSSRVVSRLSLFPTLVAVGGALTISLWVYLHRAKRACLDLINTPSTEPLLLVGPSSNPRVD